MPPIGGREDRFMRLALLGPTARGIDEEKAALLAG